ncbi:MFS transporter [Protaetiibacter mangrovi]|uniref:MFS transporter n=1 Tax=Protaetiibacter mangrovi TaxID=2970926 RepID=A0ABT1ZCC3_9MICO|nr:MFS transporter [Protaetiibacter mangrovi]MCS0498355.1 MFS transporter [Protaetiibacter mangrovi]
MTTPTRPAHATAWRNAVFAVFALNGLGAATWAIRIPAIRDHLELSTSFVGYLILGVSVGSIVGLLLASHVIQWLGGRRSIAIMLVVCAGALVVIGVGTSVLGSFAVVVLGMAVYGFGSAICDVAMNVEGAAVEKAIGRTIMPLFHASWSAGTVVGTSIGTALVFAHVDIAAHTIGMAALLLLGAVIAPRAIPRVATHAETGEEVAHVSFRDRMAIWLEPRTLAIGLIALGMAFTEGSANDWLTLGMVDDRGLENGQAAALFTLFTASMMVGRIAGGPLIDRFGRVRMLWITGGAAAVGLALVIFVPVIPVAVAGIVLWGIGASLGFPVAMSAAADDPARAAARVSAVATVGYCAFLVGPPLIGVVGEHVGILNALIIVFVLIVLATLAAPAARPPRVRA